MVEPMIRTPGCSLCVPLVAPSIEKMDGRIGEQTGRGDGLEGRVLRLEARVLSLEDDRKPRRPRRQR